MKKIVLMAALFSMCMAVEAKASVVSENLIVNTGEPKWEKSATGNWMGKDKIWYKVNTKDASIWWSKDGKKWEAVKDNMWQDKDGKWLKIVEMDLKWSADGGKTWSTVPEWKWEGPDGTWYKFDKDWTLWTAKK